jgi:tetratricopeptide (TPR) repeat protein
MNPLLLATALWALGHPAPTADSVPLFTNLGSHSYSVTTADRVVQRYFDQGLRLYYAFNHAEAIRAFREGVRRDPDCAMCWWGVAAALGPNINAPMEEDAEVAAFEAVREAVRLAPRAGPVEQALIHAMSLRYGAAAGQDRAARDSAYARALGEVAEAHPADLEAATLHAEALMTLRPWSYWTRSGDPEPGTELILRDLERVIAANPDHPGACHFYIHAVEAVHPQWALPCAERLAALMPGAGHLVHMPAHIYIRVGRYADAIRSNEHAVHADETYIRDQRPGMGIYVAGYYPHNYDFMAFAAAMAGMRDMAVQSAEKVAALLPLEFLRAPGMTMLQNYAVRTLQMLVRFEEWEAILAVEAPDPELLHSRAVWHYARGRAYAALRDFSSAERELAALSTIHRSSALDGLVLDFNEARTILEIASHVLAGIVAAGTEAFPLAIEHLREAAALEDGLVYGEPPEWSIPVRHDLGSVLLAAGRPVEAEAVFLEDLARFPENGWALRGLAAALRAQGKEADAAGVEARARASWGGEAPGSGHHEGAVR